MSNSDLGGRSVTLATGNRVEREQLRDETYVPFITGFPCTQFNCPGILVRGGSSGQEAVVCSTCEHVHYLLSDQ